MDKIYKIKDTIFKRFRKIEEFEIEQILLIGKSTNEDKTKYIKVYLADKDIEWFDNLKSAEERLKELNNDN